MGPSRHCSIWNECSVRFRLLTIQKIFGMVRTLPAMSIGLNRCYSRFRVIWVPNIELIPSNLTSPHLPDDADAHTNILLLSNLYYCIEDFHIHISTILFSSYRRYIEWYYPNSPYIAIIQKCALYIYLFQSNYARATW